MGGLPDLEDEYIDMPDLEDPDEDEVVYVPAAYLQDEVVYVPAAYLVEVHRRGSPHTHLAAERFLQAREVSSAEAVFRVFGPQREAPAP